MFLIRPGCSWASVSCCLSTEGTIIYSTTGSCERDNNILKLLERDTIHLQIPCDTLQEGGHFLAWNVDSKSAVRQVVKTTECNCWFGRAALFMTEGWQVGG